MTQTEFSKVIGYLELSIGRPIFHDPNLNHAANMKAALERTRIYFDLLKDLPFDALDKASQKLVLERKWPTFPQVAEIRELAVACARNEVAELSPGDAWEMAWNATGNMDPDVDGSVMRACKGLPPLVVRAMEAYGIMSLVYGKDPVTVVRAQFMKIFEQISTRERRVALLPPTLRQSIENGKPQIQSKLIGQLADSIGKETK